jgi:Fe-S-cluster containining protein
MSTCKSNGCSGKCCEAVTFPFSPEEFFNMKDQIDLGEIMFTDRFGKVREIPSKADIHFITDMLIPLERSKTSPATGEYIIDQFRQDHPDTEPYPGCQGGCDLENGELYAYVYTCKHFDKENKICTVYEQRPHVCRSYGYGCQYNGCTFNERIKDADVFNKYKSDADSALQRLETFDREFKQANVVKNALKDGQLLN